MLVRLVSIFSLVAVATAQSCTSFASVVQGNTNSPPAGLGIPDCAYITANSAAICNTMASWDIANSDTCYLKGPGYGCTINPGQFSTTVAIYCQLGPAAPVGTATASGSASASASASVSALPSVSAIASVSPSASVSVSSSASPSITASVSPSATAFVSPSANPTASALATPTSTATPTPTQTPSGSITPTPSFTSLPSANVTIIYENAPMSNGVIAAIAFSSIFGILVVFVCCGRFGIMLRRSPTAQAISERIVLTATERIAAAVAERRTSVIAVVERRNSKASEPRRNSIVAPNAERRKSTLELRAIEVQIEKKDLT
jgi:hypothetical protein